MNTFSLFSSPPLYIDARSTGILLNRNSCLPRGMCFAYTKQQKNIRERRFSLSLSSLTSKTIAFLYLFIKPAKRERQQRTKQKIWKKYSIHRSYNSFDCNSKDTYEHHQPCPTDNCLIHEKHNYLDQLFELQLLCYQKDHSSFSTKTIPKIISHKYPNIQHTIHSQTERY